MPYRTPNFTHQPANAALVVHIDQDDCDPLPGERPYWTDGAVKKPDSPAGRSGKQDAFYPDGRIRESYLPGGGRQREANLPDVHMPYLPAPPAGARTHETGKCSRRNLPCLRNSDQLYSYASCLGARGVKSRQLSTSWLGEDVITSGIANELEHFQDKLSTDQRDQRKCSELLASLRYGEEAKRQDFQNRRPKTAMAALGLGMPDLLHVTRPYETTYAREYIPMPDPSTNAKRPMTSQGFQEPETVAQRPHVTNYDVDFCAKDQRPATPIRSGSSSGNRANKPHPLQSFMLWKFPGKSRDYPLTSPWSEELTNERLNQVTKRLCRSTYQHDYLGIPQGFQVKSAYGNTLPDWKEKVPYTLDSEMREHYRNPVKQPEHLLATNRYGCNKKKHLAVNGVVPTANTRLMDIKTRTTYDRHFNDKAPEVALKARDPERLIVQDENRLKNERPLLPADALKRYRHNMNRIPLPLYEFPMQKKMRPDEPAPIPPLRPMPPPTSYRIPKPDLKGLGRYPERVSDFPGPQ